MCHSSNGYSSPTNHLNGPLVKLMWLISKYLNHYVLFTCLSFHVCRMQRPWQDLHSPVAFLKLKPFAIQREATPEPNFTLARCLFWLAAHFGQ